MRRKAQNTSENLLDHVLARTQQPCRALLTAFHRPRKRRLCLDSGCLLAVPATGSWSSRHGSG